MSTSAPRSGGPSALMLPVMMIVVIGGVAGLGFLAGLGPAAVLGALSAMFCLIAAFGGALWPDLKLLAVFAPAMVLVVAGPRLLAEVSAPAAIAVLTVIVFAVALLPTFGPRFITVGLGLGMGALFGYAFQTTGTAGVWQVVFAPALGVGVVIVFRLLLGLRDPDKPTRAAVAGMLTATDVRGPDAAIRAWRGDRQRQWLGQVLDGGLRYRTKLFLLADRVHQLDEALAGQLRAVLDAAKAEAAALAAAVVDGGEPPAPQRPATPAELPGETSAMVVTLWDGLDRVRTALTDRDRRPTTSRLGAEYPGERLIEAISWQSAQFRHALRCAIGVLLALLIAAQRPGDPLMPSFLMAVFMIMQPDWRASALKAWQRAAGTLLGALALVAVLWVLPQAALMPIGLVAMMIGFGFQQRYPIIFNGCMVLMLVGMNATTRHLDPGPVLVEYVLLIVLAVGIGLLFGFAVVPGMRAPSPLERLRRATEGARAGLAAITERLGQSWAEIDVRSLIRDQRRSAAQLHELLGGQLKGRDDTEVNRTALAQADDALRGLRSGTAGLLMHGGDQALTKDTLDWLVRALGETEQVAEPPEPRTEEQRLLIDSLAADVVGLRRATSMLSPG
ncbi:MULTISPECIES: FUSC family protein [unclassified Crossiella]|uniref:FUSC family protein n=1 Tax=unclassified Crossiella TaxID=2620835 RepID=UPI001FFF812E|nr:MULTISPECIES: FUSC family protein [unclassified Crossiella]MCK2244011.1 FUSC family protein [Crossiella sp. S99.2]MCK2257131.1 FUSC family protein [Crossiella sp. S99.1]